MCICEGDHLIDAPLSIREIHLEERNRLGDWDEEKGNGRNLTRKCALTCTMNTQNRLSIETQPILGNRRNAPAPALHTP